MNYGALLADSWKTIWKHKALLAIGSLSGLTVLASLVVNAVVPDMWNNLFSGTGSPSEVGLSLLALGFLLLVGGLASVLVQTGILAGARAALSTEARIRIGPTLAHSVRCLWRVMGAWLVLGAILLVALGLTLGCQLPLSIATAGLGTLCSLPFLLVGFFLLGVAMDTGTGLAAAGIVLDDLSLPEALRTTWSFIKKNTRAAFVTGILLSALLRASAVLLAIPEFILSFVAALVLTQYPAPNADVNSLALALPLGYLPIQVFGLAIAQAFVYCGWALVYLRLSRPVPSPQTP